MMKPRSLRRTFQEQSRFLFNQERTDYWYMSLLRADLPVGTAYEIEVPLAQDPAWEHWQVIHPKGSRVRHIHIMGDSVPLFADGVVCYPGQVLALLMGRSREDIMSLKSRIHIKVEYPNQDPALPPPLAGTVSSGEDAVEVEDHGPLVASLVQAEPGPVEAPVPELTEEASLPSPDAGKTPLPLDEGDPLRDWADWNSSKAPLHCQKTITHGEDPGLFDGSNRLLQSRMHFADFPLHTFEPRGAMAEWKDDILSVSCSTSWPHLVRRAISEATGLAQRHIKVTSLPAHQLPDRFLLDSTLLAVWASLGALHIMGKAQLFIHPGEDEHWGTRTGTVDLLIQSAHDPDGRLLGIRSSAKMDMGAYPCASQDILQMSLLGMCGVYRCPVQEHRMAILTSSVPPRFPPSLMGMNFTIQGMEQHIEHICQTFGYDSINWRVQNIMRKGESCPWGTMTEHLVQPRLVLHSANIKSDYSRSHAAMQLLRSKLSTTWGTRSSLQAIRGTGIALSFQSHGLTLARELESRARLGLELSDDGHLTIRAPMHAGNQGLKESWIAAVEESLGIEERNISFVRFSTQDLEDVGPARFSRVASLFSPLLSSACASLKKKIRSRKFPFSVQTSWVRQKNMTWDEETFKGTPFLGRSWASAVVELSLNPVELAVQVRKVCIAIHAGTILHPSRAEAQVRQTVLACLGWLGGRNENQVDGESFNYQENPRPPEIIILFENQDEPLSPAQKLAHAGALGELVYGCLPGAYNNALYQITRIMPPSTPLSSSERSSILMPSLGGERP